MTPAEDHPHEAKSDSDCRVSVDTIEAPAVVLASDGRIIDANRAFGRLSGYELAVLRRLSIDQVLVVPSSGDRAVSRMADWLRVSETLGVSLLLADGARLEALCDVLPVTTARQGECRLLVFGTRMRKKGHDAEKDSRFVALIDAIFDAYYDWHIQTGVIEFSPQLNVLLGLRPQDSIGSLEAWEERLHPEDRERTVADLLRGVDEPGVWVEEYRLRREDGSYVTLVDRGLVLRDEYGRPVHMVGVMRDVTHEREAERIARESAEIYHTLFESSVNAAFHLNDSGHIIDANAAGLSLLGKRREEILGCSIATYLGDEVMEAALAVVSPEGQATRLDVEVRIADASKSLILAVVPCPVGGASTCFALATDVTDRRALERALLETNTALRVILEQRDRDRLDLETTIRGNVDSMVLPLLERLVRPLKDGPEAAYLDAAIQNLCEIVRPIAQTLGVDEGLPLTLREREIANLIRAGKTSEEISAALHISLGTVAFHRMNLRKKYGLGRGGPRLASHLAERMAR